MRHETVPLRADIRLLGGVLGEVIREQDGQALFDRIEAIRQASVAYHREPSQDRSESLQALLSALDLDQTVRFAHSFASFSQLTNIAEDQARRRAAAPSRRARAARHGGGGAGGAAGGGRGPRRGAGARPADVRRQPVLTAHPTEIRRKSIIDRVGAISELLDAIDGRHSPVEREQLKAELHRQVVSCGRRACCARCAWWSTTRSRRAVGYLRAHLPARAAEALCGVGSRRWWIRLCRASSAAGSWVGGDRDGNPNVGADSLRAAFRRQAKAAMRLLSGGDPCARRGAVASPTPGREAPALEALADGRRTPRPTARTSPTGGPCRASMRGSPPPTQALTGEPPPRPASAGDRAPYASAAELQADLKIGAGLAGRAPRRVLRPRPAAGPDPGGGRASASTWPPSTCARTPTCTSGWWRTC